MWRLGLIVILLGGCGGGGDDFAPGELIADPAVDTACTPAAPAAGAVRAKWVACTDELPPGRLVSGRVGDLLIENARIKVIIRGFGEGNYLMGTKAGGIVDAAHAGGEDLLKEIIPVFELNGGAFDEFVITEAGDDGPAEIVVRGPIEAIPLVHAAIFTQPVGAIAEQHYILEPDSDALKISTILYPDGGEGAIEVGDAFFFGGRLNTFAPGRGELEGSTNLEILASSGTTTSLGYTYESSIIQWLDIASAKIGRGPTRTLGNPEPVDRWLIVGDGSASSVTGPAWALRGVATGSLQVTWPGGSDAGSVADDQVDIVVDEVDGTPVTRGRARVTQTVDPLALPAGTYTVHTESPAWEVGESRQVTVTAGETASLELPDPTTGTLALTVTDVNGGGPLPARVHLSRAGDDRILYSGADGTLTVGLPPGDWTLVVSRGMEYDAFTASPVTIVDRAVHPVAATLERVVDTSGWIAVDTHLHSEMSLDSQIPLEDRLLACAAEGVEMPISTDHDYVTDYAPVVADLGLGDFVAPQIGCETSSIVWGHVNSWPLRPEADKAGRNPFPWYEISPAEVFTMMRGRPDDPVIQLNHPYAASSGNLALVDFDPDTLEATRDPTQLGLPADTNLSDWNFDAVEVANDLEDEVFQSAFEAWLALAAGGHPAAATGSSDSHGKSSFAGKSRTYVYVGPGNDDPTQVVAADVDAAIKARKVVVAQGVFVVASIVDPGTSQPAAPGEMVDLSGHATADLHIKVQAPPWLPTDRIYVYAGRELVSTIDLDDADTAVVRYDDTVTLPVGSSDGMFVVAVQPVGRGDPVLGGVKLSFTNALRYDIDGDADWNP